LRQATDLLDLPEAEFYLPPLKKGAQGVYFKRGSVAFGEPGDDGNDLVEFQDAEGFIFYHGQTCKNLSYSGSRGERGETKITLDDFTR
jgi:hypothetical protein